MISYTHRAVHAQYVMIFFFTSLIFDVVVECKPLGFVHTRRMLYQLTMP